MHYIATIYKGYDNYSTLHKTIASAEHWLDSENNNLEYRTVIDAYNDDWQRQGSIVYTEEKQ